jgi:3-deoxy-D-manno-octulosonic acid kinase
MNLTLEQAGAQAIVYDAQCIQQPGAHLFDPEYWQERNAVEGSAPGRGNTLMLKTPFGPAVLRTYLRGGWAARLSRERYIYTGLQRSRPLLEASMLEKLVRLGMPAPRPLAALCTRSGLAYTGALLMHRIMPAMALADLLQAMGPGDPCWFRTGQCISRFHAIGLVHADLNARNILVRHAGGAEPDIYLVDFDRACFRPGARRSFRSNLRRLRRSLAKLWPARHVADLDPCWEQLMIGYNNGIGYNNELGYSSETGYNKGNGYNTDT